MSRAVEEWVAKHDDQAVPQHVKLRIWRRQENAEGYAICHISGIPIRPQDSFELDHIQELVLGGQHRESNLAFALTQHHRQKTASAMAVRAETDAQAISHRGLGSVQETGLQGRTKEQKRAAKDRRTADSGKLAMQPGRSLYRDVAPSTPLQIEDRRGR